MGAVSQCQECGMETLRLPAESSTVAVTQAEEALLKQAVLPGGNPSVSVLAWLIQKPPKGD